jgi:chromosome segregation ATPase
MPGLVSDRREICGCLLYNSPLPAMPTNSISKKCISDLHQGETSMAKKKRAAKKVAAKSTKASTGKTTTKPAKRKTAAPVHPKSNQSASVDRILKKYQNERVSQEKQLAKIKAKIADLKEKAESYRRQIEALAKQEVDTEQHISQLDTHRDSEISELLDKLGIRVTSASKPKARTLHPKADLETVGEKKSAQSDEPKPDESDDGKESKEAIVLD